MSEAAAVRAGDLAARLEGLRAIGRGPDGTTRLAWTPELGAAEEWFERQAADLALAVERDPAGNLWARPSAPPPWWALGSHLDTVPAGGAFDGALGVAAAFEVARAARRPAAVIAFADEEGARFNTPTFGSRALAGRLDPAVLDRRDAAGVTLRDALTAAGVDPDGIADAPAWLPRLRGFLELHIDQSRAVARAGVPAAPVASLAARTRLHAGFRGSAGHAGTTPMDERRDALAAAARLVVEATTVREPGLVATATRLLVRPNAPSTIPEEVELWLDGRAPEPGALAAWTARVRDSASGLAATARVQVELQVQSRSDGVGFDPQVRSALAAACRELGHGAEAVVCYAGHDAGIVAERLPAGMLLVRNETGMSHAPDEQVSLEDAAWGAEAMRRALEALE